MKKQTRILSGVCALIVGLSLALPMRATADDKDHGNHWDHDRGHQGQDYERGHQHQSWWRWDWDKDHYRGYPYTPPPAYAYSYQRQYQYIPENGQGMINPRNPNLLLGVRFRRPSLPLGTAPTARRY